MNINCSPIVSSPRWALLGLLALLLGCSSTPQHTNVLIFGTNTKVALNVSQDPTSGVGVTLGYKRQEAVWMPLLPNQVNAAGTGLQPAPCTAEGTCPKFIGDDSQQQKDTYSVLASFGRIGNSTAYGEVWHGFWARNHCGFPEYELAQLPNCRIAGRESTFGQPHTQPNPQRVRIPASTSHQLTR